jgi:glutaredoxin
MDVGHVDGKKRGNVTLYGLSTCAWCKMTKDLLTSLSVDYSFIYVDLLGEADKKNVMSELKTWVTTWPHVPSFPMLIIDNKCVFGYQEEIIRDFLKDESQKT